MANSSCTSAGCTRRASRIECSTALVCAASLANRPRAYSATRRAYSALPLGPKRVSSSSRVNLYREKKGDETCSAQSQSIAKCTLVQCMSIRLVTITCACSAYKVTMLTGGDGEKKQMQSNYAPLQSTQRQLNTHIISGSTQLSDSALLCSDFL